MTPPPRHSELGVLGEQRRELHAEHPEDCRRRRSREQVTQDHCKFLGKMQNTWVLWDWWKHPLQYQSTNKKIMEGILWIIANFIHVLYIFCDWCFTYFAIYIVAKKSFFPYYQLLSKAGFTFSFEQIYYLQNRNGHNGLHWCQFYDGSSKQWWHSQENFELWS